MYLSLSSPRISDAYSSAISLSRPSNSTLSRSLPVKSDAAAASPPATKSRAVPKGSKYRDLRSRPLTSLSRSSMLSA